MRALLFASEAVLLLAGAQLTLALLALCAAALIRAVFAAPTRGSR